MPKNTQDDILIRRSMLSRIVMKLKKEGRTVNRFTLKPQLKKAGFDVDESTIYRDLVALNRENTWVRDLAESSYSAYQEQISDSLDWVIQQAREQYQKKWTQSKKIVKQIPKGKKIIQIEEHTITAELAQPKAAFLNVIVKAEELKMKHTNGENINISAALLTKEFQNLKKQYAEMGIDLDNPVDIIKFANQTRQKPSLVSSEHQKHDIFMEEL